MVHQAVSAGLYRAIDQHGQVIDVVLSQRRDLAAARRFFARALRADPWQRGFIVRFR